MPRTSIILTRSLTNNLLKNNQSLIGAIHRRIAPVNDCSQAIAPGCASRLLHLNKAGPGKFRLCLLSCFSNSVDHPANYISDDLIPAVFVEDFVEEIAVNLHLPVSGRRGREKFIGVTDADQTVFSPCSMRTGYLKSCFLGENQFKPSTMA